MLAACSGDSELPGLPEAEAPSTPAPADEPEPADEGGAVVDAPPDGAEAIAQAWIPASSGLSAELQASLVLAESERAGNVTHVRFEQVYQGYAVDNTELIVHVLGDGNVQGATSSLSNAQPTAGAAISVDEAAAVAIASKAVDGTVQGEAATSTRWVEDGSTLRLAWRIDLTTLSPLGAWSVYVDAGTAAVIRTAASDARGRSAVAGLTTATSAAAAGRSKFTGAQSVERCELPPAPSACVFVPDPIFAAGGTLADPSTANDFLSGRPLLGLVDPSSGALVGEFANLEPRDAPIEPTRQEDALWGAGRGDAGFEAQNVYYWIDYGQRTVQRLGFDSILNQSFPVVPIDPETVDNAFYSSRDHLIYLGVGSNGIHEGEDATGILHEYGHALLDDVNPNLLANGDVGAYHEGFGDIFAALTTIEFRNGDWPCFFMWTDQECLRRMDTNKVYPDDLVRQVHTDGEIYTSAIGEIFTQLLAQEGIDINTCPGTDQCNAVRDRVLTTVLASNYYLTENMSMPDIAASFVQANEAQYASADASLIVDIFASRGLAGGSGTIIDAEGNTNGEVAAVAVEIDIAHSYRGDLDVSVGVIDPEFNELCTPIVLFTPDENDDEQDLSGVVDISDTDCAPLAVPTSNQIWFLFVEDTLPDDEGAIVSFSVIVGGDSYLATGLPLPIADADPRGSAALIDGTGQDMTPQGGVEIGSASAGATFITASLDHTYHGDLSLRAGVADAEGTIVCSLPVLEPDPSDSASGTLDGDIDMTECEGFYPPSAEAQWFLQVIDTAAEDTGTINQFTLNGSDGSVFDFSDLPVDVPDDDVDGIALLLDGTGGSAGQAGGSGQGADLGLPGAAISISHPFAGDLAVTGGVIDPAGNVLCEVTLHSPDANNDGVDLFGEVSLAECGRHFPPTPDRLWFLFVADTLSEDTGTVEEFVLYGPDGTVYTFQGLPVALPDADPDGVVLVLDGSELGYGAATDPIARVVIGHPYVGDLDLAVGVTVGGDVACGETVASADIDNDGIDLAVDVPLGACSDF